MINAMIPSALRSQKLWVGVKNGRSGREFLSSDGTPADPEHSESCSSLEEIEEGIGQHRFNGLAYAVMLDMETNEAVLDDLNYEMDGDWLIITGVEEMETNPPTVPPARRVRRSTARKAKSSANEAPECAVTDETYAPISRGLIEHLRSLTAAALKVYLWLLLTAAWKGAMKGKVAVSVREISGATSLGRSTISRALAELEPYYIERIAEGRNQHDQSIFKIRKYKTVSDFRAGSVAGQRAGSVAGHQKQGRKISAVPSGVPPAVPSLASFSGQQPNSVLISYLKKGERRKKHAPPPFVCTHADCPNRSWHIARLVAETQQLSLPYYGLPQDKRIRGRWLAGTPELATFPDALITEFTRHKFESSPRWRDSPLLPRVIAEDLPAYVASRKASDQASLLDDPLTKIEEQLGEKKAVVH